MQGFSIGLVLLCLLGCASEARAQIYREYWGVAVDFTPTLDTPDYQKFLFSQADGVDLSLDKIRVGVVRGAQFRSHWGLSFMSRTVADGGVLSRDGASFRTTGVRVMGVEVYKFKPVATIRDLVQLGVTFGIGAGFLRGEVVRSAPGEPDETLKASHLFVLFDRDMPVMPTGQVEFSVLVLLRDDLKLGMGAGFDFPGQHRLRVSAIYFFGTR